MSDARVGWARKVSAISFVALLLLQLVEFYARQPPLIIWLAAILPLLIFVPGMWADNLRSYIWLCFVCLLYFVVLVLRLFAEPTSIVSILGMVSVVSLFVASMLYVRWRARQLKKEVVDD